MDWSRLADLGGTVVVAVMSLILLSNQTNKFTSFLGNHMGKLTAALNAVCQRLEAMETRIEDCHRGRDRD